MILSIISGTYNRLAFLQDMIASARASLPPNFVPGVDYEIVLADGGSTDGTIEWCETEPGVKLVKQGELLGAIKAFNAAGAAASGDYLLVANDDVTFEGYSIAKGLSFIMDNPDTGAVCFYQDRSGKDWHVENMGVWRRGEQVYVPYVQVGLIPRWLWDKCGGWGDWGGHTYGGDNYISGRIYESGYKVVALEGCRIHDKTPPDSLREINHKPDNLKVSFWEKFPNSFTISDTLKYINPLPEVKRVLYAPIIEAGHDVQKAQKNGLREALKALGPVWECDYVYSKESVADAAEAWAPYYIITQFHDAGATTMEDVKRIKDACQGYMINWSGDVWADQASPALLEMLRYYDYHLTVNATLLPRYADIGIKAAYWQNSFEPPVTDSSEKFGDWDVLFLGNCYSVYRLDLARVLKALPFKVGVYGRGYPDEEMLSEGESLYNFHKTGCLYRGSKIAIADNQFLEAEGFFSDRAFMIMASGGCLMMHQKVARMEDLAGLKSGVHYVEWTTKEDLKEKIAYYMEHEEERKKIADAGTAECRKNHTFAARVLQLQGLLRNLPKRRNRISAMMIVKNEESNIDACISLLSFADEIVIVDTGSTDKTTEKIFNHPLWDKVSFHTFDWEDDFAAARNFAKSKCQNNWIFWMDADDRLPKQTLRWLKDFDNWPLRKMGAVNPQAFCYKVINYQDGARGAMEYQTRLFKNITKVEWRQPIHETTTDSLAEMGISGFALNSEIHHHSSGDPAIIAAKQTRNLDILKKQKWSPWRNMHVASSYAAMGRWGDAAIWFEVAEQQAVDAEAKAFLAFAAGYALYNMDLVGLAKVKFQTTEYPDALYLLATIEESLGHEALSLYRKFYKEPVPTMFPTFAEGWKPDAKKKLLNWHRKELEALVSGA